MSYILRQRKDGKITWANVKQFAGFLFVCLEDQTIYLAKRSKNETHMAGYWEGLGGHVDKGESPEEAAIREVQEEAGSMPIYDSLLKSYSSPTPNGGEYHMFIANLTKEQKETWKPKMNPEHDSAKWFDEIPDDIHPSLLKQLKILAE